jgi:hypothetical protein
LRSRHPSGAVRRDRARVRRVALRPAIEGLDARVVPTVLTVANNLGSGFGSLRAAIGQAQSGDTIQFGPALRGQTIQLYSGQTSDPIELLIAQNITIQGPGANLLAIDANNLARAFEIRPGAQVTISGLTIEDGNGTTGAYNGTYDPDPNDHYGGGILNEGTLTLSGCSVIGNRANSSGANSWGGGVANFGKMTMSGSVVSGNTAVYGGGVYNSGTLTLIGDTVTGNSAYYPKYDDVFNTGTLKKSK